MVNNLFSPMKLSFLYDSCMESKLRDYLLEKQVINKWKQGEMAEQLKVPKGTLSRWLSGQFEPDLPSLRKIAQGLGVSLQEVVDAAEGKFRPMSKFQRDAIEIKNKYDAEAVALAYFELSEKLGAHSPEEVLEALKSEQEKRKSAG